MKLHIPERSAPAKDAFPNHPRKVKKWLAELPNANMGELTRQLFSVLRDLNRQSMPSKYRLENMEQLRQPTRDVFDYLKKYFINRTLPLPEKSRKIINLNLSLLNEMAYGYKTIVFESANGIDKKADNKMLATSACRATRYLSELLLRASEIYAETPKGMWHDLHELYVFASDNGFADTKVSDSEHPQQNVTMEDYYKQVLLFSLARPIALRQSDTERLYHKLNDWAHLAEIHEEASESQVNRFFCAVAGDDHAPTYLRPEHCSSGQRLTTLNASGLVDLIRKQVSDNTASPSGITVGDEISQETLKVLAMSWGVCSKRRFSRADKQGHIAAAIGLTHAAEAIRGEDAEPEPEEVRPQHKTNDPGFTLESIPTIDQSDGYLTHTEVSSNEENAWDMVASGKTLTDAYDRERKLVEEQALNLHKEDPDLHWEVVNVSAGGYCLRWNSDNTSRAQIGEVIALREREPNGSYQWRIGIIRWMQFTRENGLEIGVQVLSPKVIAATIRRTNKPNEEPFEALMLPGIRPLKQPPSVITPSHAFKSGDKLTVNVFDQDMDIRLGDPKEHTGSFTQFEFLNFEQEKRVKKAARDKGSPKSKDDFDEIWSSL